MPKSPKYEVFYDEALYEHFKYFDVAQLKLAESEIENQLSWEPTVEAINRKPLRIPNFVNASWELRLGFHNEIRIFYKIEEQLKEVHILAAGIKLRSRLKIAGEEVTL